jgi:hypothetical protein
VSLLPRLQVRAGRNRVRKLVAIAVMVGVADYARLRAIYRRP